MQSNFDEPVDRRGYGSIKEDTVNDGILPMFVADMDFRAPPHAIEAIQAMINHGIFGYGQDTDLPVVIKQWFHEEYQMLVKEEWITLLPAIVPVLAAVSRLREGKVLINTPNYNGLLAAPTQAGKEIILSPLKNTNASGICGTVTEVGADLTKDSDLQSMLSKTKDKEN